MKTWIVLLRGVMPYGKNKVPMADLRARLEEAGLVNVLTYIQTGNIVAETDLSASKVEELVHDVIKENYGGDLTVIALEPGRLEEVIHANPFPDVDTSKIYFTFLKPIPKDEAATEFRETNFSPDEFRLEGDILYACYNTKVSDSQYSNNWFEKTLGVRATTRNWNTTSRVAKMAGVELET